MVWDCRREERDEAAEAIRGLVERIVLTPGRERALFTGVGLVWKI